MTRLTIDVRELDPPVLEFGGGEATDPKVGLAQMGPFSLRFGAAHKDHVRVGLVGPPLMLERSRRWFERCAHPIDSLNKNKITYPDFPGFTAAFHGTLNIDSRWQIELSDSELDAAMAMQPRARFETVLDLYARGVERLANSELRPDVIVCCLSDEVAEKCRTIANPAATALDRRWASRVRKAQEDGQLTLFDEWGLEETPEDLLTRDFRRALKARAMTYRMPIQLGTTNLFLDGDRNQDAATRAWNVGVALFYKAGGIPWRLKTAGPETCFVGISFHHLRTTHRHLVYSSLAQAFSTEGEGFALRGDAVPWDAKEGRHPHLTEIQAAALAEQVLAEYRERTGHDPSRIVLHKTSKYDSAEQIGFRSALNDIPIVDLVNITPTRFRLVQDGLYPPKRGTVCLVNGAATYLFTTGYIPEWKTYPGPHIPVPVEVVLAGGGDVLGSAADVLGLSRMNWNTARDTSGQPITLRFARQVGGIMAEVGPEQQPHPSYRFYI